MRWRKGLSGALVLVALLGLSGCSKPTAGDPAELTQLKAENDQLKGQVTTLQGQVAKLQGELQAAQGGTVVNLVDAHYPKGVLSQQGWEYAATQQADLDGDGKDEKVVVLANVTRDAAGSWLWDDGHVWNVYIEEPDGTRTYAFVGWIQMGVLEANLTQDQNQKTELVLMEAWNNIAFERVIYHGPQQLEVRRLYSAPRLRALRPQ